MYTVEYKGGDGYSVIPSEGFEDANDAVQSAVDFLLTYNMNSFFFANVSNPGRTIFSSEDFDETEGSHYAVVCGLFFDEDQEYIETTDGYIVSLWD